MFKFVCLLGVYLPTREFFTHMETSPLPVKGCKFWRILGTNGHWAHSVSLGRFVPHHASAVWRKAPLQRTIFRLNLEKKWLRPSACLQVERLTGVIFIIHCSYLVIPKLYFIEIEVNSIKGKICKVLKWLHL